LDLVILIILSILFIPDPFSFHLFIFKASFPREAFNWSFPAWVFSSLRPGDQYGINTESIRMKSVLIPYLFRIDNGSGVSS